jgi:hypothetical protein
MNSNAETIYRERIKNFSARAAVLKKRIARLSNLRFALFFAPPVIAFFLGRNGFLPAALLLVIAGLAGFFWLVAYHNSLKARLRILETYVALNRNGMMRLENAWEEFPSQGGEFADDKHPFAVDLDMFGRGSVFQWIDSTHTLLGRNALAAALGGRSWDPDRIHENQGGVRELATMVDLRQTVEVQGIVGGCGVDPGKNVAWAEDEGFLFAGTRRMLFLLLPAVTIPVVIADALWLHTRLLPSLLLVTQLSIFAYFRSKTMQLFSAAALQDRALGAFSRIARLLEDTSFSAPVLERIRGTLTDGMHTTASRSIARLSRILSYADVRHNAVVHFLLNLFLLWDIFCAAWLERWKKRNGKAVRQWLEAIGEFEKLSSLSIIRFEHPEWAFPKIDGSRLTIAARDLRHPLLPENTSVGNDFSLGTDKTTAIITGSNMSGKSTFLRAVGVNLVLAYTGAPVSARELTCGFLAVCTSMQTRDDLRGNISTYYAELLRIKGILDTVASGRNTLFLIDEIFSGTNSRDRTAGAVAVLKALQRGNTLGVISTHDLELCNLARESGSRFENYHFREFYEDDEIRFDYRLRAGPSKTRNALFLIRQVGIPVDEADLP